MSEVVKNLEFVLADAYILSFKIQTYHWNVKSTSFPVWHAFFETLYRSLSGTIDVLAERIRQLGEKVPSTLRAFFVLSTLKEASGDETLEAMLVQLVTDYEKVVLLVKKVIAIAEDKSDSVTADCLTTYLTVSEKSLWMLKSSLSEKL